ncbi:MAG TPA: hypothetical protein VN032_13295 [Thermoanaerobaculia bacterium]|jgi:hypothetical protein|nr:hypothetical protein [Thermoanaerobaculia bacterium]
MSRRTLSLFASALFVFYCTTVGVYLTLRPWTGRAFLPGLLGSGFFRGFVSGLGLVHLAAGFADLRSLTRGLDEARQAKAKSE